METRANEATQMEMTQKTSGITGILVAAIFIAGIAFFSYAAFRGEYGLFRLFQVQAQQSDLLRELTDLQSDRARLENRTRRLSNDYLDLDLLDEQARKILGSARGDEIIIR